MGYMTVIVASNDEAHDIKKNGERFVNDLHHAMCSGDGADTVGATVHPPQHTDIVQVVLAGGNTSVIAHASHQHGTNVKSREGQIEVLRAWARDLGFDLVERG